MSSPQSSSETNNTSSTFQSEQDRIEYLKARGIEIDLVRRKDTAAATGGATEATSLLPSVSENDETLSSPEVATAAVTTTIVGGGGDGTLETMSMEERQQWLRDHGVEIVEAAGTSTASTTTNKSTTTGHCSKVQFVKIPCNASDPLEQCYALTPSSSSDETSSNKSTMLASQVDILMTHLTTKFAPTSASNQVDISLFDKDQLSNQLLSSQEVNVSNEALQKVAQQGHVEVFTLVHPRQSNKYTGIQLYLDEVGMLKRLPLNSRASKLAMLCGFDPPPKFYGDIYVGRLKHFPTIQNVDFVLGHDLPPDLGSSSLPQWIQTAASDNIEYQMERNKSMGIDTNEAAMQQLKLTNVGEDGKIEEEEGGAYSWTQTNEEIELIVPLSSSEMVSTKHVQVMFHTKRVTVKLNKEVVLTLDLFADIDPDGCTWTLEKAATNNKTTTKNLIVSCEKSEGGVSWPRIKL